MVRCLVHRFLHVLFSPEARLPRVATCESAMLRAGSRAAAGRLAIVANLAGSDNEARGGVGKQPSPRGSNLLQVY